MKISNIINLSDNHSNKNTILTIVLFLYLFIANNSTKNLFSGQLTNYIDDNRFAQHLIAFITVLVLVTYMGNIESNINIICYSIIIYSWFILTTKIDLTWNILLLGLLLGYFFYQNKINHNENIVDPSISKKIKKNIINNNNNIKKYFVYSLLLITFIGSSMYCFKKYSQYGNDFDMTKFMFNDGLRHNIKKN